jgi:hypothetical protein
MTQKSKVEEQLRAQVELAASQEYSSEAVELKIAASLLEHGKFSGHLDEQELTTIIRNVVYDRFSNQRIGGRDIHLVHNIPAVEATFSGDEVIVSFLVHIHKPIVAFLRFRYVLTNDPYSKRKRIQLKRGSLSIRKDTRRFDLKARAALAAIDVDSIARDELTDLADILKSTFTDQLTGYGIGGGISEIQLAIGENCLEVYLEGDCRMAGSPQITN